MHKDMLKIVNTYCDISFLVFFNSIFRFLFSILGIRICDLAHRKERKEIPLGAHRPGSKV